MAKTLRVGGSELSFGPSFGIVLALVLGAAPTATMGFDLAWLLVSLGSSVILLTPWLALRQVTSLVDVELPPAVTVHAGKTVSIPVHVRSRRRIRLLLVAFARPSDDPAIAARAPRLLISALAKSREWRTLSVPLRVAARGRGTSLELTLTSSYPFGLVSAQRSWTLPVELTALPRLASERDLRSQRALHLVSGQATESRRRQASQGQGLPASLRDARHGDTLRDMHMRSSLRRSRWTAMERPHHSHDLARVTVFLPTGTHAQSRRSAIAWEAAISLAAAVVQRWTAMGWEVELGTGHAASEGAEPRPVRRQRLCTSKNALHHLRILTDLEMNKGDKAPSTARPYRGQSSRSQSNRSQTRSAVAGMGVDVIPVLSMLDCPVYASADAANQTCIWVDALGRTLVETSEASRVRTARGPHAPSTVTAQAQRSRGRE